MDDFMTVLLWKHCDLNQINFFAKLVQFIVNVWSRLSYRVLTAKYQKFKMLGVVSNWTRKPLTHHVQRSISLKIYLFSLSFSGGVDIKACSCSNACSELFYESRVSYSRFPDVSITNVLQKYFGKTENFSYMRWANNRQNIFVTLSNYLWWLTLW